MGSENARIHFNVLHDLASMWSTESSATPDRFGFASVRRTIRIVEEVDNSTGQSKERKTQQAEEREEMHVGEIGSM